MRVRPDARKLRDLREEGEDGEVGDWVEVRGIGEVAGLAVLPSSAATL